MINAAWQAGALRVSGVFRPPGNQDMEQQFSE